MGKVSGAGIPSVGGGTTIEGTRMMKHKRCGGYIAVEEFPDTPAMYDLVCVNCGKRLYLKRSTKLGKAIRNSLEPEYAAGYFRLVLPSGRRAVVHRNDENWSAFVWGSKDEGKREVPA